MTSLFGVARGESKELIFLKNTQLSDFSLLSSLLSILLSIVGLTKLQLLEFIEKQSFKVVKKEL